MSNRDRPKNINNLSDSVTAGSLLPLWEAVLASLKFMKETQSAAEEIAKLITYQASRIDQMETQVNLLRAEVKELRLQLKVDGREND